MSAVITVADFCESAGWPSYMVGELYEALVSRQTAELAAHETRMARTAGRPDNTALPLRDEEGDFGVIEARIPATLFFNLAQRENFGWEGLQSDEGIKDILRDVPQSRVKTVSGKVTVGWTGRRERVKSYEWKDAEEGRKTKPGTQRTASLPDENES